LDRVEGGEVNLGRLNAHSVHSRRAKFWGFGTSGMPPHTGWGLGRRRRRLQAVPEGGKRCSLGRLRLPEGSIRERMTSKPSRVKRWCLEDFNLFPNEEMVSRRLQPVPERRDGVSTSSMSSRMKSHREDDVPAFSNEEMVSLRYFKLFLQYKEENSLRLHDVRGRRDEVSMTSRCSRRRRCCVSDFKLFQKEEMLCLGLQAVPAPKEDVPLDFELFLEEGRKFFVTSRCS